MGLARIAASATAAFIVLAALAAAPGSQACAADLGKPTGPVILTITGAIATTNAPGRAEFDQAMLAAIGTAQVKTSTDWTDGPQLFEGVVAAKLLDAVGAHGTTIEAKALDDYVSAIPLSDLTKYPVILAWSMNGKQLTPSDKGPLWLVYPRDDYPELQPAWMDDRWVWQLKAIEIK
jgi:hypothetical protein